MTNSNTSSTPTTDINTSRSGDYIAGITTAAAVSGAGAGASLSFASGVLAITNNTGSNKTYYLWGHRADGDSVIVSPFASGIRERYFYAIPIN